jgi:hypothetical protein
MKEKYRSTRAWLTRLRREVHVPLKNKYLASFRIEGKFCDHGFHMVLLR